MTWLRYRMLVLATCGAAAGFFASSARAYDVGADIDGWMVYVKDQTIYKMDIDVKTPVALGSGRFARWNSDGDKIAYVDTGGNIGVMNADGSAATALIPVSWQRGIPIEFHPNGEEIIYTKNSLMAVKFTATPSPTTRTIAADREYDGEPGIDVSGRRMVARVGHDLYALQFDVSGLVREQTRLFETYHVCAPCVSPDGSRLANNIAGHTGMAIRDWDGSNVRQIAAAFPPVDGAIWDNFHWSNHPDYLAVQGDEDPMEAYVVKVSTGEIAQITSLGGGVVNPDLWVDNVVTISGTITDASTADPLPGAEVVATGPSPSTDAVSTLTDDDGVYRIMGTLDDGDYTISLPGLTISSGTNPVTIASGADVTGASFQVTVEYSDDDGANQLPDWWELRHFGDLDEVSTGDPDSDGVTNYSEYLSGTSPTTFTIVPAEEDDWTGCAAEGRRGLDAGVVLLACAALAAMARNSEKRA